MPAMPIDRQSITAQPPSAESPVPEVQFGYFLLHTHTAGPERTLIRLTLEDLGTGNKSVFESTRALMRFLDARVHGTTGDERWAPPHEAAASGSAHAEGGGPT